MKIRPILLSLAAAMLFSFAAAVPPAAQAQQGAVQPPLIKEFQTIEDQWSTALVKRDQYTLETILSPTMVNISSAGEVSTRDEQVAAMYEKGLPEAETMEQRVVNVRVIEDVAVVDGTYIERTKLNGVERDQRGVFTHVFQHVRGVWVCVHSQRTAVVDEPAGKTKSEKKTSDGESSFHIPFTHKKTDSTSDSTPPAPQP